MKIIYFLTVLLWPVQLLAQRNELVEFDVRRQLFRQLPAVAFDTLLTKADTGHSFGRLGAADVAALPTVFPASNVVPGTAVSQRVRSRTHFGPTSFPARTAVTISVQHNGQRTLICSGSMVGERHVLTVAHALAGFSYRPCICADDLVTDSLLIEPAYDNGRPSGLPSGWAIKFYMPLRYLQRVGVINPLAYDIALLELSQPIGRTTGWLGLGFATDLSWAGSRVWHKFSYPGQDIIPGLNRYNGDTLFYEYGQVFPSPWEARLYAPDHADGIPGQSGSSLFVTDNHTYWTTYGVFSSTPGFEHAVLTPQHYAAFRQPMLAVPPSVIPDFELYPNPAADQVVLRVPDHVTGPLRVQLTDMLGRVVHDQPYVVETDELAISLRGLRTGGYVLTARSAQSTFRRKLMKVQ